MNCPAQLPRWGDHAGTWFSHGKALTDLLLLQDQIDASTDLIGLDHVSIIGLCLLHLHHPTYPYISYISYTQIGWSVSQNEVPGCPHGSDCAFSDLRLVLGYCISLYFAAYVELVVISSSHLATGPEGELLSVKKLKKTQCSTDSTVACFHMWFNTTT